MVKNLGGFYLRENSQKSLSFTPNDGENPGTLPYSMEGVVKFALSDPKHRTSKRKQKKNGAKRHGSHFSQ